MEKEKTARKNYKCDTCRGTIKKGQKYNAIHLKLPKFDEDGESQIGVEYLSFKECELCKKQDQKEQAEWDTFTQTEEYKYQQSMWEHRYP